jgi:hypothetical protein
MQGIRPITGLTQGRANLLYQQVFNVRDFGAKGDETTTQFFRTNKHVSVSSSANKAVVTNSIFPGVTPDITVSLPPARQAVANNV